MKKNKFISFFVSFALLLAIFLVPNYSFKNRVYAEGLLDSVFGNVQYALGDIKNNLFVMNFSSENNSLTTYMQNNQVSTLNQLFNTDKYSLNSYYKQLSNNKFNLTTNVLSANSNDIIVFTIDKSREYFMPYYFYNNQTASWQKNTEGYFKYEVVSSNVAPDLTTSDGIANLIMSEHKLFVYDDSNGAPYDSDESDGIVSYSYAKRQYANFCIDGIEAYLRELELISLIDNQIGDYIDLTASDNYYNNEQGKNVADGYLDMMSILVLDDVDKNYRVEWSDLLWAHESSLGALLDAEITLPIIGTGKLVDILQQSFFGQPVSNMFASYVSPHISDPNYASTYVGYAKDRPKVSDGSSSLNIDDYYLTRLNAKNLENVSALADFYNVFELNTIAHEMGHILGLPDLYIYNSSSDVVGYWSLMCSQGNPQHYMTSYERKMLGWLDETSNIKTLTTSGNYTLQSVQGYDNLNTVAYRVQGKGDYSNQWFYFEYRNNTIENQQNTYWEKSTGSSTGLLVYRVDESVVSGNMYAETTKKYGLSIFTDTTLTNAPMVVGETIGNFNSNTLTNSLTYQTDTNLVNSMYKLSVLSTQGPELQFNIILDYTAPTIETKNEEQLYTTTTYVEDFSIKEKGVVVPYTLDSTLSSIKTYKIEYYKSNASFTTKQSVSQIDTNAKGYFIAVYTIKDSYGEIYTKQKNITIEDYELGITVVGGNLQIEKGRLYSENGLSFTENGSTVSFDLLQSSQTLTNRSYKIGYFTASSTFDKISSITAIDCSVAGFYLVEYNYKDYLGNEGTKTRQVQVYEGKVAVVGLDSKLEQRLKTITGLDVLYTDSLKDLDLINLSTLGLDNFNGLDSFEYKNGVIIDFGNNNVSSYSGLNTILEALNNAMFLMVGNKLDISNIAQLTNTNAVIGLQTLPINVFLFDSVVNYQMPIVNDFASYYTLYINDKVETLPYSFTSFSLNSVYLKPTSQTIGTITNVQTFKLCGIIKKVESVSYDYSNVKTFDVNDFITFNNVKSTDLAIDNTYSTLVNNILDLQHFKVVVSNQSEKIVEYEYEFKVVDKTAPVLSFSTGKKIEYTISSSNYLNNYGPSTVLANDEFEGNVIVKANIPQFTTYGKYTITYTATDESGNQGTLTRDIFIGNVSFRDVQYIEYNVQISLPFLYNYFSENDFNISYALDQSSDYIEYLPTTKIVISVYGNTKIKAKFVYKDEQSFNFEINKIFEIKDTIAPTVSLLGEKTEYVSIGATYEDKGVDIKDNSGDNVVTTKTIKLNGNVVDEISTMSENEYQIVYTIKDLGGNQTEITRIVKVGYEPIKNIVLIQPTKDSFKVNEKFSITILPSNTTIDTAEKFDWYVNDEYVSSSSSLQKEFSFTEGGIYKIYAKVNGTEIKSQSVQIIIKNPAISNTALYIIIGVASSVILFAGITIVVGMVKRRYY